jgi:hypothetical protein
MPYSNSVFEIPKKLILIMNAVYTDICCPLFKYLNILPLHSQCIFSLSIFAVTNTEAFKSNSAIHGINNRHCFNLHPPTINLSNAQKLCIIVEFKFSIIYH